MSIELDKLFELQKIDIQIDKISKRLSEMSGGDDLKKKLLIANKAQIASKSNLIKLETELKDNELQLKTLDTKRETLQKRLYSNAITNSKELSSIEKEIESIKERQSSLDEKVLGLYDEVSSAKEHDQKITKIIGILTKQIKDTQSSESSEKIELESNLEILQKKREPVFESIDNRSLLSKYYSARKKIGGKAISFIVDNKCSECKVSVTFYILNNMKKSDVVQSCESCGRILFLEKE